MDCEKFNEYITEYEARRLTKKQELEFLHHKDVCEECNIVYNLVFNDSQIHEISYMAVGDTDGGVLVSGSDFSDNYSNSFCGSIMEKIQNIEQNSYNFKFYNIMHIAFGVLMFGLFFIVMFLNKQEFYLLTNSLFDGTRHTLDLVSLSISNVSNHAINSVEQCAIFLYVLVVVSVAIGYLYSIFKTKSK